MFSTPISVLLALTGVALLLHRVGMWASLRYIARASRARACEPLPAISLLKPIKGTEDELEENLRSFYAQDYAGPLQIVFASADAQDPGIAIARKIAGEHPAIETLFAITRPDYGLNPKVCNIQAALVRARHDLVLQSDANVRVTPDYLSRLVGEMQATSASLIGSIVVGVGERSAAAVLENLQLTAFTAPGLCMAKELADITCVLGKSMLFRRSELDAVGGLAAVKDVLAEDYVLCQLYERHGKRLALSATPVFNVNVSTTPKQFIGRHSRWLKMRAVVSAPGYAADLGSNPLPFALAAFIGSGFDPRAGFVLAGVYAYKCYWDGVLLRRLRGQGLGLAQLWTTPTRDLVLTALWVYGLFSRSTQWRGKKLRLAAGSVLLPDDGPLPQRLLRRMGLLRG